MVEISEIVEHVLKLNVEKLSKNSKALSKDSPVIKLLVDVSKLIVEKMKTLDLDKAKVKKTLGKLLSDDKVKNLKVIDIIKTHTEEMIDIFFAGKKDVKKMLGGDEATCSICMVDFTGNEDREELICCPNPVAQPCKHKFHRACIETWLTQNGGVNNRCPECSYQWNWNENDLIHPDGTFYSNLLSGVRRRVNRISFRDIGSYIVDQINGLTFSRESHLGITCFLLLFLCCFINSRGGDIHYNYLPLATLINIILYGLRFYRQDGHLLITFNDDTEPLVTIYRVQQYICILCIIYIQLFTPAAQSPDPPSRPPPQVDGLIVLLRESVNIVLNNTTDVDMTAVREFREALLQNAQALNDETLRRSQGGSMKARRKSRKIRGRKSNRKKLSKKTRRRV